MYENVKPFPLERYKFVINDNKVIAISTYAGKTVRGVAQCHPNDHFDLEKGKELAAARCDLKVRRKRLAAAIKKADEAWVEFKKAEQIYDEADLFVEDATNGLNWAEKNLAELEANFHKPEIEVEIYPMGCPEEAKIVKMPYTPQPESIWRRFIKWLKNN